MKVIQQLRRFILIKSAEGNHGEIRALIAANLQRLSQAFHVTPEALLQAVSSIQNDRALAFKLLESILKIEAVERRQQKDRRILAAQASANALASCATWKGDRALIDMPSLLSSALTSRRDLLVFTSDQFTVGIHMAPLLDLSKVIRARTDLSGWVDRKGIHLRWRTGGLNLLSQEDPDATRIIVFLPPIPAVAAA